MTEKELRQKVVSTAEAWLGTREYSDKHYEMLDIYNAQSPLPRGTRMQATWPWCAAFVSTVSLQCGLRGIMPTECGCPGMVRLYQELGRWVEDDAYVPSPGDVIFYDWQDSGVGDNAGQPDHVGIVLDCDGQNMTIIEGDSGIIVVDPLISAENAAAALKLYYAHRPHKPVVAVIYSHSHVDHYGGVHGVVDEKDVAAGKVQIIAPKGFMEAAVAENVLAGNAMSRRAQYMYGSLLPPSPRGHVGAGLGLATSRGTSGLLEPTRLIEKDGEALRLDGLTFVFQMAPNTEAPAEMHWYIPELRALTAAENCTHSMHSLYTLRGAQVRDANDWAKYIIEADQRFCSKTDVVFQSHNWPHWGEEIHEYLLNTAAIYKFTHDQTLHYMNQGYTSTEIAAMLTLPEKLEKVWYTRPYYGTLAHNAKAVYQKYLGWYDANPVNLNPLPPSETAKKMVEYLGSTELVLCKAKKDYAKGEYQWVAQITKELVYADPANQKARNLCADALEQLGYQAESGAWRNAYLMGAAELRNGNLSGRARTANGLTNSMRAMTVSMLLDYIAILTDANAAQNDDLTLNLTVTDENEQFYVTRKNGVLLTYPGENRPDAQASVTCRRLQLFALMTGQQASQVQITGDATVLKRLLAYASKFEKTFNVIEP